MFVPKVGIQVNRSQLASNKNRCIFLQGSVDEIEQLRIFSELMQHFLLLQLCNILHFCHRVPVTIKSDILGLFHNEITFLL